MAGGGAHPSECHQHVLSRATATDAGMTWKNASILLIDDNHVNLTLLERVLEMLGVDDIRVVNDPLRAESVFAERRPDLVLLDLHMPHLDGFGVMERFQAQIGGDDFIPIIVVTADSSNEARERALAAGAKDFVTKPINVAEVVLRVANLLESRALYKGLREHNAELAGELLKRDQSERIRQLGRAERIARVESVLARDAIDIVFQPIVDLRSGHIAGVEALSRFPVEPQRAPDVWFDEATSVGLGAALELRALERALAHIDEIPATAFMSVNLSPEVASQKEAVDIVRAAPRDRVVVEITEHGQIRDRSALNESLDAMRDHGVRVAVDDAGAGFAGLQQILDLRPEIIKLDIAITHAIDSDPIRRALASCLLTFATDIGSLIVAEGIETKAELVTLQQLGVGLGQGYFLAVPGSKGALFEPLLFDGFDPRFDFGTAGA